jgi:hypothetical protein
VRVRDWSGVTGALLGILVLVLLAATGLLVGLSVSIRGVPRLVLAAYVVAYAEIVLLALFLSVFDAMTRSGLVAGVVLVFVAALALWTLAGAPRPAPLGPVLADARRRAPLGVLAVFVALASAYTLALVLGTAPNGWDPLNYHLARAAFWLQSQHVGYIADAYDQRLNFNPPNAEIGIAFALGITRNERTAGLVQFFAFLASGVGVAALARTVGCTRAQALVGGLLFLLLPIVLLQSGDAKNDVVVASFLVAAAVLLQARTRWGLALAGVATALAVGAKFTAAYGLVFLVALALLARPQTLRVSRLVTVAAGAIAGSYWYLVNHHETGRFLGDQSGTGTLTAPFHPAANVVTAFGDLVDTIDLSGAKGSFILLFVPIAVIVALALVRSGYRPALAAGVVVISPLLLLVLSEHVGRPLLVHLYNAVGKPPAYLVFGDDVNSAPTTAGDTVSWFGPVGLFLVSASAVAAFGRIRRRTLPASAGVLAAAPIAWLAMVALTLTYHPWQGRFFVFPVALSAALWGALLDNRSALWAVTALGVTTATLSLANYVEKPAGFGADRSVWHLTRAEVQSNHDPPLEPLFRFLDRRVPRRTSIGLAFATNDFGFPVFGPHLARQVVLVPDGSSARETHTAWLVTDAQRATQVDAGCWKAVLRSERGAVFTRRPDCAA